MTPTYAYLRWVLVPHSRFITEVVVKCRKVTAHVDGSKSVYAVPVLLLRGNVAAYYAGVDWGENEYVENSGWAITLMEPL